MPKAISDTITKAEMRRTLPLGDALQATVARMQEMAATAYDTLLLAEGPPPPDWQLLEVAGEALRFARIAEAARRKRSGVDCWPEPAEVRAERDRLNDEARDAERDAAPLLRRAGKMRATSPAGIYAKALLVRASKTGAAELAMSLAEDMVACTALRATLWPAGEGGVA